MSALSSGTPDPRRFKSWTRPGPVPPGCEAPAAGETLDYLCGHFRIFQYERGHRFSTDDLLTAWYGTQWAPRVEQAADLGSGIGSVAMAAAWRLPAARFCTVEAQELSLRLARKSVRYNGLESRFDLFEGDLRDPALFPGKGPFDLVLGSPPYFPPGTALPAAHPQAVPARMEMRGGIAEYAAAASRILAPGGLFAFVFPFAQKNRACAALDAAELVMLRRRDIVFREGDEPVISLFAAARESDIPPELIAGPEGAPFIEPPLVIRLKDGRTPLEYATIRMSFGFPPGQLTR